MTSAGSPGPDRAGGRVRKVLPWVVAGVLWVVLYRSPIAGTATLWWTDADAGHGLLLVPLAGFLAWRAGLVRESRRAPVAGLLILGAAVTLRFAAGIATELFMMRVSAWLALVGMLVFGLGWGQARRWWLPLSLVLLSLPLPEIAMSSLALPLQFRASQLGAALLEWRHVPVRLAGNIIQLPGHSLFVTEACSGLRSLSALIAIGLLVGGLWMKTWWGRALIVAAAIPIAMVLNGVRIFLTGFAVFFIDPKLGNGVMHYTEGWGMFLVALAALSGVASIVAWIERRGWRPAVATGGEVATA
ncbi:MAG: exosortase/archaeosortase family protein [Gemmatimonadetes bacterium]|nr:exosortase/archaeosortase family protein [Gemmatimonadota bacterium]